MLEWRTRRWDCRVGPDCGALTPVSFLAHREKTKQGIAIGIPFLLEYEPGMEMGNNFYRIASDMALILPRAVGLVAEWMRLHETELIENWKRARNRQPLEEIQPLT